MKPIEFPGYNTVVAANQPPYQPLYACNYQDATGRIACCWNLSLWERFKVLMTGKIWHQILTFQKPLQPQLLSASKPLFIAESTVGLDASQTKSTRPNEPPHPPNHPPVA